MFFSRYKFQSPAPVPKVRRAIAIAKTAIYNKIAFTKAEFLWRTSNKELRSDETYTAG